MVSVPNIIFNYKHASDESNKSQSTRRFGKRLKKNNFINPIVINNVATSFNNSEKSSQSFNNPNRQFNKRYIIKKIQPKPFDNDQYQYWKYINRDENLEYYKNLYNNYKSLFVRNIKIKNYSSISNLSCRLFQIDCCDFIDKIKTNSADTYFKTWNHIKSGIQIDQISPNASIEILSRNINSSEQSTLIYDMLPTNITSECFYNSVISIAKQQQFNQSIKFKSSYINCNQIEIISHFVRNKEIVKNRNEISYRFRSNKPTNNLTMTSAKQINYPLNIILSLNNCKFTKQFTKFENCFEINYCSVLNVPEIHVPVQMSQSNSYDSSLQVSSEESSINTLKIAREVDLIMMEDKVFFDSSTDLKDENIKKPLMKSIHGYFHVNISSSVSSVSQDGSEGTLSSLSSLQDEAVLHSSMIIDENAEVVPMKYNPYFNDILAIPTNKKIVIKTSNEQKTSTLLEDEVINLENLTVEQQMISKFQKSNIKIIKPPPIQAPKSIGDAKTSNTISEINNVNNNDTELKLISDNFIDSIFHEAIDIIKSQNPNIQIASNIFSNDMDYFTDFFLLTKIYDNIRKMVTYCMKILKTFSTKTTDFSNLLNNYMDKLVRCLIVTITDNSLLDIWRTNSMDNPDQTIYQTAIDDCSTKNENYFIKTLYKLWRPIYYNYIRATLKSMPDGKLKSQLLLNNNFNDFIKSSRYIKNLMFNVKYFVINLNYQINSTNNLSTKIQYSRDLILRFIKILSSSVKTIEFFLKNEKELLKYIEFLSANYKMFNNQILPNNKLTKFGDNLSINELSYNITEYYQKTYSETGQLLKSSRLFTENIRKLMLNELSIMQFFKYLLNMLLTSFTLSNSKSNNDSLSLKTDVNYIMNPYHKQIQNSKLSIEKLVNKFENEKKAVAMDKLVSNNQIRNASNKKKHNCGKKPTRNYQESRKHTFKTAIDDKYRPSKNFPSKFKGQNNNNLEVKKKPDNEESRSEKVKRNRGNNDTMAGIPSIYDSEVKIPVKERFCGYIRFLCTCCCCRDG